jgi:hypothetical protein
MNKLVPVITLLICIRSPVTLWPRSLLQQHFHGLPQSLQANARTIPQIRPQPSSTCNETCHCSLEGADSSKKLTSIYKSTQCYSPEHCLTWWTECPFYHVLCRTALWQRKPPCAEPSHNSCCAQEHNKNALYNDTQHEHYEPCGNVRPVLWWQCHSPRLCLPYFNFKVTYNRLCPCSFTLLGHPSKKAGSHDCCIFQSVNNCSLYKVSCE